jgi:hypothetical protein
MPQGDDAEKKARRKILRKYARVREGRPVFCGPSRDEKRGRADYGIVRNGKVIFDTREQAEAACTALRELTGEMLRPYACPRSRHGHHHLTHDRSPANRWAREEKRGHRARRDHRVRDDSAPVPLVQEVLGEPAGSGEAPAPLLVPPGEPGVQDLHLLRPDGAVLQPGRAGWTGALLEGHQPEQSVGTDQHVRRAADGAEDQLPGVGA